MIKEAFQKFVDASLEKFANRDAERARVGDFLFPSEPAPDPWKPYFDGESATNPAAGQQHIRIFCCICYKSDFSTATFHTARAYYAFRSYRAVRYVTGEQVDLEEGDIIVQAALTGFGSIA